jgi:uncharacterized repeat protein (TIGR01451 family)
VIITLFSFQRSQYISSTKKPLMKPLITLLICAMAFSTLQAQKLQNAFSYGNTSDQHIRRMAFDTAGNLFVIGSFLGSNFDVDPSSSTLNLNSNGSWDIFLAKYSPSGELLNAFSIGGTGNDQGLGITLDSASNVYVTGWFRGVVDFDPSTNTANVVSNGENGQDPGFDGEAFLAKYNSNLQYQWAFGIGGPSILDAGLTVRSDKKGNVILGGVFQGTVDFDPSSAVANMTSLGTTGSFIAKYSVSGQYKWALQFGGGTSQNCELRDIGIDNNSNIYITGHFDGSIDLNPGSGTNMVTTAGCGDVFVVKLDSASNYVWGFNVGGSGCDYPIAISVDPFNKIYISGYFASASADFNPGSAVNNLTNSGNYDGFVAKYDENGNYIFAQKYGSSGEDVAYDIMAQANGYVVVGYFNGTVDFDPSPATNNLTSAGLKDIFVAHFSSNGTYLSSFKIGSSQDDAAYCIALSNTNEYTISGYFRGTNVDFDPLSTQRLLTSAGGNDVFIARYTDLDLVNKIKGSIYVDLNGNGIKDGNESFYSGARITATKGSDTVIVNSSNGKFSLNVDTGVYITKAKAYVPYYTAVPASATSSFATYQNSDSVSFAIQPITGIKDLAVSMFALTPVRPGFKVLYQIFYYNKGTDTISTGYVKLIKDSRFNLDSTVATANTISGDTLTWNFNNLAPRTINSILVYLKAKTPATLNIGDTLNSTVSIYPIAGDSTPLNNVSILNQRAVGSYDPNDKKESHGGKITTTQISDGEYLQYTIRFQNTGTDTAFNINIRDTLSSKLDWSSLEMITASHNYQLNISGENKCSWSFANINLADSNTNEPLSHGYIVFRIKPKSSLAAGDIITNKAFIYFDYNLPVATNLETTTVQTPQVLPVKLISFAAQRQPGYNLLSWTTALEDNVSHFELQRSSNARDFETLGKVTPIAVGNDIRSYSYQDVQPPKTINYYRLTVVEKDGNRTYSEIRKVNNQSGIIAEILSNPVKENLAVKVTAEKVEPFNMEIVDLNGHMLYSSSNYKTVIGSTTLTVNIADLPAGVFFIRIKSSTEQIGLKFIKE